MVMGCRIGSGPDSLPKAKSKADLVLLCSARHSGKDTEYKMVRSLYATSVAKVPYKIGDVVSSFTRMSSEARTHDSVLIFYEMQGGELQVLSEIAVYGDDVPAFRMTLKEVINELSKP
ncbi:hypothetical protein NT6N_23990 [Oceaniferula spumae]|uniref:Uncharacterized protein n=1 Tax=Oceaniferula spumae TaxID=2979115 RepID=A0AAT9FMY3_9BACT